MTKETLNALLKKDLEAAGYGREIQLVNGVLNDVRALDFTANAAGLVQRRIEMFAQIRKDLGIRCSPHFRDSSMNDALEHADG